jgi:hypothetical protein
MQKSKDESGRHRHKSRPAAFAAAACESIGNMPESTCNNVRRPAQPVSASDHDCNNAQAEMCKYVDNV